MICGGAEVRFCSTAGVLPNPVAPARQIAKTPNRVEKVPLADNAFNISQQYGLPKQWQEPSQNPLNDCLMVNTCYG